MGSESTDEPKVWTAAAHRAATGVTHPAHASASGLRKTPQVVTKQKVQILQLWATQLTSTVFKVKDLDRVTDSRYRYYIS